MAVATGSWPGLELPAPAGWSMTSARTTWVCSVESVEQTAKAVVVLETLAAPPDSPTAVQESGSVAVAVDPEESEG